MKEKILKLLKKYEIEGFDSSKVDGHSVNIICLERYEYDVFADEIMVLFEAEIERQMPTEDKLRDAFEAGQEYNKLIHGQCVDGVDFNTWYRSRMKGENK